MTTALEPATTLGEAMAREGARPTFTHSGETVGEVYEPAPGMLGKIIRVLTRAQARRMAGHAFAGDILFALQAKPFYEGTVPAHVKARRRAQNRRAKASRKVNR